MSCPAKFAEFVEASLRGEKRLRINAVALPVQKRTASLSLNMCARTVKKKRNYREHANGKTVIARSQLKVPRVAVALFRLTIRPSRKALLNWRCPSPAHSDVPLRTSR